MTKNRAKNLREGAVFFGFFWGIMTGGILTFVRGPRIRPMRQVNQVKSEVQSKLTALTPSDPVQDSIEEGKAAARRRLAELDQQSSL
jgi:hypothetical protein